MNSPDPFARRLISLKRVYFLLPVLALLPAFLGGATDRWSQGAVLIFVGLLLCWRPPRFSLGLPFNAVTLGLICAAAAAFLPANFLGLPAWRVTATEDLGLPLGPFITPQPWLTAEAFVLLLAGLAWCHSVCTVPSRLERASLLKLFCAGVTLLAIISIALYFLEYRWPFWNANYRFGPFPNRNQTANLLAIGSLITLACVHEDFRYNRRTWIGWSIAASVLFAALVLAYSRAAIILFFAGVVAWIVCLASVRRSGPRLAIGAGVVLILWSAFLFGGSETLDRFLQPGQSSLDLTKDFRWTIQQDALALAKTAPWTGIGLGNFESQFWLIRKALGPADSRIVHPESDWLWLAVEMGWPAVGLALAGFGLLIARAFPFGNDPGWRLRTAAAVGGLIFILHGVVDVSAHRLGSVFPALFVLGMAMRPRRKTVPSPAWVQYSWRAGGLAFCVIGSAWLLAGESSGPLPGQIGLTAAKNEARQFNQSREFAKAIESSEVALRWAPMDWELYYLRAVATALGTSDFRAALMDFSRARFLNPITPAVPFNEGLVWASRRPILALPAWQDALKRGGGARPAMFEKMMEVTKATPGMHDSLREMASGDRDLLLAYLSQADPQEFTAGFASVRATDPGLTRFDPSQLQTLVKLWRAKGHNSEFMEEAEKHPEWLRTIWASMAECYAERGDYKQAFELARVYGPPPVLPIKPQPEPVELLERALYKNPRDFARRYALYEFQMRASAPGQALSTLQKATAQDQCPTYFFYLQARLFAAEQKWQAAWESLKRAGVL